MTPAPGSGDIFDSNCCIPRPACSADSLCCLRAEQRSPTVVEVASVSPDSYEFDKTRLVIVI